MTFAILPVKNPQNAKQRLKGFLAVEQRESLARLLYRQTLAALQQAEGIDRVVVVTSDRGVAEHARCSGALVFEEDEQVSHSASADAACLRAMELGALQRSFWSPSISRPRLQPISASLRRRRAPAWSLCHPPMAAAGDKCTCAHAARLHPEPLWSRQLPCASRLQALSKGFHLAACPAHSWIDVRHRHSRGCVPAFGGWP